MVDLFTNPNDTLPIDWGLPPQHTDFRAGQGDALRFSLRSGINFIEAPTGCHRAGTEILMYNGTIKLVENIVVGDQLMGPESRPRTVLSLVRGQEEMFEIIPVKGTPFVVNGDHVLTLIRTNCCKDDRRGGETIDVSVLDYLPWSNWAKHIHKLFRVPCSFPAPETKFPIDAYFLGTLLGNGHLGSGNIAVTTMDKETVDIIYEYAHRWQMKIRAYRGNSGKAKTYYFSKAGPRRPGATQLKIELECLSLVGAHSGTKFIPHRYKVASRETRLSLLAGLMDTDGYLSGNGCYDYVSKSSALANDIAFVAHSLGFAAYVTSCVRGCQTGAFGTYYRVSISGDVSEIPCRIKRKQSLPRIQIKDHRRTGLVVEKTETIESFFGFTLDSDGRYLMGDFTVTHNSGKTALPCAAGAIDDVTAICRTKNLQEENYDREYGFTPIYGKSNYGCIHDDADLYATAQDCLFTKRGVISGMHKCSCSGTCPYLVAKARFMAARRGVCNYAYWMSSAQARRDPNPYLYLDEGHQVISLVLDWTGLTVFQSDRTEWGLPAFPVTRPIVTSGPGAALQNSNTERPEVIVDKWIEKSNIRLQLRLDELQASHDNSNVKQARKAERLLLKLKTIQQALRFGDDWFIESGRSAIERGRQTFPGLVARPLSPKAHFSRFFPVSEAMDGELTLNLMSATIGNFDIFAEQLGIPESEFESHVVPPRFGPERQPMYDIGAPAMGRAAKPAAYEKQADMIAACIKTCPSTWSGIIHVTRWTETKLLAARLKKRGIVNRLWLPQQGVSTRKQVAGWAQWKRQREGQIIVTPSLREGFNGLDEKMCIIAKAPFGYLGTKYNRARMKASRKQYLQETAWDVEQAKGRTRRGREQDYDTPDERRGLVVLADGSARKRGVFKYLSVAARDSIVKGMP